MSGHEPDPERPPLGGALASARDAAGLTTRQVAEAINLRETVVRAIEADDFTPCGGDVYAKGHLRAYARLVGLDVDPLLAAFTARKAPGAAWQAGEPDGARPVVGRVQPLTSHDVPFERSAPNWTLLAGAALAVLVLFLGFQLVGELRGPGRPSQEVAAPVTTPPTTTPSAGSSSGTAAPSVPPSGTSSGSSPSSTTATVPVDGVVVALKATGDSWVTVKGDSGKTMFAGLLGKGERKKFSDSDSLRVTLGNAGGVQLTVNGKRVGSAGRDGEVKRLTIRPGDPA